MRYDPPERVTLLVGALVLVVSFGAGGYTYATFTDVETTSASIQAASDFTTSVEIRVEPSQIEANSGGGLASSSTDGDDKNDGSDDATEAGSGNGVFTVYADVPDPVSVVPGRFTLRVAGGDEPIRALRARCKPRATGDWTCKATFSRRDLLALGVEPGPVTIVLQGWRAYDRDFEGIASVEVVDAPVTTVDGAEPGTETERRAAAAETGMSEEANGLIESTTTGEPTPVTPEATETSERTDTVEVAMDSETTVASEGETSPLTGTTETTESRATASVTVEPRTASETSAVASTAPNATTEGV